MIFEFGMKCLINIISILLLLILYSENLVTSCHCFCHKRVSFLFFFGGKLLLGLSEISADNNTFTTVYFTHLKYEFLSVLLRILLLIQLK